MLVLFTGLIAHTVAFELVAFAMYVGYTFPFDALITQQTNWYPLADGAVML